jgi:tripartite-type tricarboxylate transporter receptor subunit TctC
MKSYAESIAAEPQAAVGEELTTLLAAENDRWKAVIQRIGLEPQ